MTTGGTIHFEGCISKGRTVVVLGDSRLRTHVTVYGKAFSLDGLFQESGVTKKNDSNNKDVSYEISIKQGKINIT